MGKIILAVVAVVVAAAMSIPFGIAALKEHDDWIDSQRRKK